MSIRARTSTKKDRPGGGARHRTGGLPPRRERPAAPAAATGGKDLTDERRLRESGGPEDRQLYTCSCGFAWRGAVTASAACPNCGTEQAW
jgi:hypothetical protein